MSMTTEERNTRLIGAILVEQELLTPVQLAEALALHAERGGLLGEIVKTEFGVSQVRLSQLLAQQCAELERAGPEVDHVSAAATGDLRRDEGSDDGLGHLRIGDALLEQGLVRRDQIDAALKVQQETGARLGEILVAEGAISRLELAGALSDHWASLTKLHLPGVTAPPDDVAGARVWDDQQLVERIASLDQAHQRAEELIGHLVSELTALREQTGNAANRNTEIAAQLARITARLDEPASTTPGGDELVERIASLDQAHQRAEELIGHLVSELTALCEQTGNAANRNTEIAAQLAGKPSHSPDKKKHKKKKSRKP